MTSQPVPELEDELARFRREWQEETKRRGPSISAAAVPADSLPSTSTLPSPLSQTRPLVAQRTSPKGKRKSLEPVDALQQQLEGTRLDSQQQDSVIEPEREKERPKSALDLYSEAVRSEQEGRLNDALINYRSAFRLDPDVDKVWNRATTAAQARAARGSHEPSNPASTTEFRFERTLQLGPDYEASKEHRSKEAAHEETGGKIDKGSTHPSSTSFLLHSLLKSFSENPYERKRQAMQAPTSPTSGNVPLPSETTIEDRSTTPEEALANLDFIPADEDKPLPFANLPHEVLLLILKHLVLSPMLAPPKSRDNTEESSNAAFRSKRAPKRRTLKEEMLFLEAELDLENVDREWKSDVESLERFARVCRAARIITLDSVLWRALGRRTYVPAEQIARDESAAELVKLHGNDWRRFYVEHPRIRLDGCFISVVTYLRRGEVVSIYAPTHLITFYRYYRFYHHGLVISLLTTDPPNTIVRRLNPSLRMQGLTFGRWRLRGDLVEMWDLEDPAVPVDSRKYSFNMTCRLKSSARGRMNKLDLISMSTTRRDTLEIENLPLRPNKPYYFSKVAQYAHE
ncbi:SCF ubiquitin ligase complex subunit HRT3 [Sporobolomyces salmoneus]|uniref:SCF ubiquitin ligase complex subunit HRT3 n=1 Tax=Sporobolomyces salmoneus TaxID=183962 RepID=UPI003172BEE7